eukprot:7359803-Prymnesium_polylepis.1
MVLVLVVRVGVLRVVLVRAGARDALGVRILHVACWAARAHCARRRERADRERDEVTRAAGLSGEGLREAVKVQRKRRVVERGEL